MTRILNPPKTNWASPGAIGATAANTGSFTTVNVSNSVAFSGSAASNTRTNLGLSAAAPVIGEARVFPALPLPSGWLQEDGSAISRTTYSGLFAVIGTTFGAGNGTTTFNIPDSRGRTLVAAGAGTGLTNRAVGNYFGTETHTLSSSEMPSHNHSASDAGHIHSTYLRQTGQEVAGYGLVVTGSFANRVYVDGYSGTLAQALTSYASVSIGNTGGGSAHNNMQPSVCRGFLAIYTGV